MKAILKYPGSKWSIANWIINFFPEHHSYYDVQGRERAYAARDWAELPERIAQAAERLSEVQIECRPAVELIQRFNYSKVLIYADPPYMLETRHGKQYREELERYFERYYAHLKERKGES